MELKTSQARWVAGLLSGVGLIVAGVNNLTVASELLMTNFWIVVVVSVALGVAATWPSREPHAAGFVVEPNGGRRRSFLMRYGLPMTIVVVALAVIGLRWYKQWHPTPLGPGERPQDPTVPVPHSATHGPSRLLALLSKLALPPAAHAQTTRPELVLFGLAEERTSYRLVPDHEKWDKIRGIPTYRMPLAFCESPGVRARVPRAIPSDVAIMDRCTSFLDSCAAFDQKPRLLESLRSFVRSRGRTRSLLYLTNYDVLHNLVRRNAAALKQILPHGDEWTVVKPENGRDVLLRWHRECVGLAYPVIRVTLRNPGTREVLVTEMRYHRLEFFGGAGPSGESPDAVLVPAESYAHGLDTGSDEDTTQVRYRPVSEAARRFFREMGRLERIAITMPVDKPQVRRLNPVLRLAPGATVMFDVQMYPNGGGQYDDMLFGIDVVTTGGVVRLPEFIASFWRVVG